MKKVERYFYPAVFTYEPGQEIAVTFPDLDVATSGENEDDALISARELLGCVLYGMEEDGEEIPAPTRPGESFCESYGNTSGMAQCGRPGKKCKFFADPPGRSERKTSSRIE